MRKRTSPLIALAFVPALLVASAIAVCFGVLPRAEVPDSLVRGLLLAQIVSGALALCLAIAGGIHHMFRLRNR
jgi:ABC-type multidrug transport system permease subunit